MKPVLEELIEENNLIADYAHSEFKKIHLTISKFDLDLLKANFEDSKRLIETRQNNVVETDEDIVYLEDILSEYKSSNFAELTVATPKVNLKVEQLSEALLEYEHALPRLISENYKAFKTNLKKKDKVENNDEEYSKLRTFTKQFAQNFIDYCAIGKRYSISPWFAWFKKRKALKHMSKIIQEEQEELKELKDSFYSNLDKLKRDMDLKNIESLRKTSYFDSNELDIIINQKEKDEYASLYVLSRKMISNYDAKKALEEKQKQDELSKLKEQEENYKLKRLELEIKDRQDKKEEQLYGLTKKLVKTEEELAKSKEEKEKIKQSLIDIKLKEYLQNNPSKILVTPFYNRVRAFLRRESNPLYSQSSKFH